VVQNGGTSTPATTRTPGRTCTPVSNNKKSSLRDGKWKLSLNRFESSFTPESSPAVIHPTFEEDEIQDTWSESEDEEICLKNKVESSCSSTEDKIPLSTQNIRQQQQNTGSVSWWSISLLSFVPSPWVLLNEILTPRVILVNMTQTMNHLQNMLM
jgi:hypothetical protein